MSIESSCNSLHAQIHFMTFKVTEQYWRKQLVQNQLVTEILLDVNSIFF